MNSSGFPGTQLVQTIHQPVADVTYRNLVFPHDTYQDVFLNALAVVAKKTRDLAYVLARTLEQSAAKRTTNTSSYFVVVGKMFETDGKAAVKQHAENGDGLRTCREKEFDPARRRN